MTSGFVRPGPPELAEINRRAQRTLTAEGAQAWYQNDVPYLLMEIAILRSERERVYNHIGLVWDETRKIEDDLDSWIAERTGAWEKAQYRRLKNANEVLRQARDQLEVERDWLKSEMENEKGTLAEMAADLVESERQRAKQEELADQEKTDLLLRLAELDAVIARQRQELHAERVVHERAEAEWKAEREKQASELRKVLADAVNKIG